MRNDKPRTCHPDKAQRRGISKISRNKRFFTFVQNDNSLRLCHHETEWGISFFIPRKGGRTPPLHITPSRLRRTPTPPLYELPPSFAVFAFSEVASVRCVITNQFALHSLTRNFILFEKRESLFPPLTERSDEESPFQHIFPFSFLLSISSFLLTSRWQCFNALP